MLIEKKFAIRKNKFRFSLDISSIVPYCESEVLRL